MTKTIRIICSKRNTLDASIGNSIFRWAQGYYLNYKCNFEYKIILQEETWSELNIIDLPNTEVRSGDLREGAFRIDEFLLQDVFLNDNIDRLTCHDHLYLDEWYIFDGFDGPMLMYYDDNNQKIQQTLPYFSTNPLRLIKFKSEEVENFFVDEFSDFVSIHIRRYFGVVIRQKNLKTLPEEIQKDFYREYLEISKNYYDGWKSSTNDETVYRHPFIPDNHYYEIIEEMLDYDINQKFYISTDIPRKYYQYYKHRYRNIHDKFDYLEKFENIVKKNHDKIINFKPSSVSPEELIYYEKVEHMVLSNLLDIFALSNSKLIIQSYCSSWGRLCRQIGNTDQVVLPISTNPFCTNRETFLNTLKKVYNFRPRYSELMPNK